MEHNQNNGSMQGSGSKPVTSQKSTNKNGIKNKLPIIIVGVLLLAALIGGLIWWFAYYQKPERVVKQVFLNYLSEENVTVAGDSVLEVKDLGKITAKSTASYNNDNLKSNATLMFDGSIEGVVIKTELDLEARVVDGEMYVKADNVKNAVDKVVDAIMESSTSEMVTAPTPQEKAAIREAFKGYVSPAVKEIDGVWIRVSGKDSDQLKAITDPLSGVQACVSEARTYLRDDKDALKELGDRYDEHQFIVLDSKIDSHEGAMGYIVKVNEDNLNKWGEGLDDTMAGKKLAECLKDKKVMNGDAMDANDSSSADSSIAKSTIKMWADPFTHKLKRIQVSGSDKDSDEKIDSTMSFEYPSEVDITKPENSKPIIEVAEKIQSLLPEGATLPGLDTPSLNVVTPSTRVNI